MKVQKYFVGLNTLLIALVFFITGSCTKKVVQSGKRQSVDTTGKTFTKTEEDSCKTVTVPVEIFKFAGTYNVNLPGYTGILTLNYDKKLRKYTGEIYFPGWGKGNPQPLKKLSIKDEKIYFERSVETTIELREYGGSRYFRQKYYGKFSHDRSEISGEFIDSGAVSNWRAGRQRSRD